MIDAAGWGYWLISLIPFWAWCILAGVAVAVIKGVVGSWRIAISAAILLAATGFQAQAYTYGWDAGYKKGFAKAQPKGQKKKAPARVEPPMNVPQTIVEQKMNETKVKQRPEWRIKGKR